MSRRKLKEFVTDPASGEYSASRLLLIVMIVVQLPAVIVLEALGYKVTYWTQFAAIVGSVAGAYGVNSAARVWRGEQHPPHKPPGD